MNLINEFIKRLIFPKESPPIKWEIQPYMKTFDVCAMDMDSFKSSHEVIRQMALASKIGKQQ